MSTPLAPGIWRVTASGTCYGNLYEHTFHVRQFEDNGLTQGRTDTMKEGLQAAYTIDGGWLSQATDQLTFLVFTVTDLGSSHLQYSSEMTVGGGGGDLCDPAQAVVVSWKTHLAGRKFRGRSFFGGQLRSQISSGVWDTDAVDSVNTTAQAMFDYFDGSGDSQPKLCILHRVSGDATNVESFVTQRYIAHQRRRRIGVGA